MSIAQENIKYYLEYGTAWVVYVQQSTHHPGGTIKKDLRVWSLRITCKYFVCTKYSYARINVFKI